MSNDSQESCQINNGINNLMSKKRRQPSSSEPNPRKTHDLMSRLQAFLPQMEAANIALQGDHVTDHTATKNAVRIDLDLHSDDQNEEGSIDSDSDNSSTGNNNNEELLVPISSKKRKIKQPADDYAIYANAARTTDTTRLDQEKENEESKITATDAIYHGDQHEPKQSTSTSTVSSSRSVSNPTIQISFAVCDRDDNPVLKLLAPPSSEEDNGNEDENDCSDSDDGDDTTNDGNNVSSNQCRTKEHSFVGNLLKQNAFCKSQDGTKDHESKKPLITELN